MRTDLDLLHLCNSEVVKSWQRQKADYECTQPNKFKVGELVWACNFRDRERFLSGKIMQQNRNALYKVYINST